jgi:hypothetical protein
VYELDKQEEKHVLIMFIPLSCMQKQIDKFIHKKALDILINFLLGVYQAVVSVRPKYVCSIF